MWRCLRPKGGAGGCSSKIDGRNLQTSTRCIGFLKLLILNEHEVERLLTFPECIDVMAEALAALARGEVHQPLRSIVRAQGAPGVFGLMPAYRGGTKPAWGLKEICLFP